VAWRQIPPGDPVPLKVTERERVFYALAYWPESFDGPGMELWVAATDREQARERVLEKLRELVVGVTHPPIVQLSSLDDDLRAL
jgi:hypothetical protein